MTRSIRSLLAALALAAVTALPAAAQPPAQRGDRATVTVDSRLHDLDGALDLTDAQDAQIMPSMSRVAVLVLVVVGDIVARASLAQSTSGYQAAAQ